MSFTISKMANFETTYVTVLFAMVIFTGFDGVQGGEFSCGDAKTLYSPSSHICCDGRIEAQPSEGTRACCGNGQRGDFYFHGHKMCCGSSLRDITPDLKCCNGQQFYNDTTQTCCGAEVIDVSEGKVCCPGPNGYQGFLMVEGINQCCGNSGPFRPETELCCKVGEQSSIIRERPSGGRQTECCGLNTIDASTHMCCKNEKTLREPFLECCGSGTYNVTTELCCYGNPVPRGPNAGYECCSTTQSYNPQNEVCCFGEVHSVGHGKCCEQHNQRFNVYQPAQQSCCNSVVGDVPEIAGIKECCSGKAYLTSSQMCCNKENLFDRDADLECCGSGTYNKSTELCCNGLKWSKRSPSDQCCASKTFNASHQTCCVGQVLNGVGTCCQLSWDTFEIYDEQAQTCCELMDWAAGTFTGNVYDNEASSPNTCCGAHRLGTNELCYNNVAIEKRGPDDNEVCQYYHGDDWLFTTFDKEQAYCVISTGVTAISPGQKLCGSNTYNPATHLCCDDDVHGIDTRAGADTSCCGFKAYDKTWQSCLLGNVVPGIPEEYAGNCRGEVFDNRTDACDVNLEIRPIAEVEQYPERCGTEPFHPAEEECCNGLLIAPGWTCCDGLRSWETPGTNLTQGQCCIDARDGSSKGYNDQTHICCQGEVHDMREQDIECCGRDAYDPADSSSICCGHHVYPVTGTKTECTGTTHHRQDQIVCDGVIHPASSGRSCCGKILINTEDQVCCDGTPYNKERPDTQCCGKLAYDPSSETCCSASLHTIKEGRACCDGLYFNTHNQVCDESGGKFYVFRSEDEGLLCSEGSYDSSRHTCCQGILHKHIADGQCCGNGVVRDPEEEVCCGGKLRKKKGRQCCGSHMFNPSVHQCCGGKVMLRYSRYRKCRNDRVVPEW